MKARLGLGAYTRLAYNLVALLHAGLVVACGRRLLAGAAFDRPGWLVVLQGVLAVAGAAVFAWGLAGYDLGRFAGTAQVRAHRAGRALDEDGPLRIGGAGRYVRHPLYAGGLLLLWGGVLDAYTGATALWASLYLLIGMTFEERRLLALHGDAYRAYRARVPALVPWRGRAI
ncbi:methyltransferase family protein [Azospirillum sp. ST 5-10]|uniref:methyltransferase family protein n=1 Tax=unclassified Azospirillum TaxID=2630922 RepID=UPI003F49D9E5